MKKIYTYILCLVCTLFFSPVWTMLHAQQLPDPGFEDWSGAPYDGQIQPAYWHYSNVTQFGFNFNFAHREQGRSGYCLYIKNQNMTVMGINGGVSPGYVALGQPWVLVPSLSNIDGSTAGVYGGISWTARPDTLTVWIKRTGPDTDKENYNFVFYAWNGTAKGSSYGSKGGSCTTVTGAFPGGIVDEECDIRQALDANNCQTTQYANQVCEAYWFEKASYANWTQLRIPVYYLNDQVPEKCNLIISAGNYPAGHNSSGIYANNDLYVDDVQLIYSSKIQKLFIGNREWKGFDPNAPVQTYSLGNGVTTIPDIYAVRGAGTLFNNSGASAPFNGRRLSDSECVITKGQVDGAPTTIVVTAEDGSSTTTYQINFVSAASNNARLADIRVNNASVAGFNAYVTSYNVSLPYGTTDAPVVAVDAQDAGATVSITQATSPSGTATVEVTAGDGTTKQTYTIRFSVAQLSDNTLQDILIDGVSLTGFTPSKSNYTVSLPLGTTAAPAVTPVSAYPTGAQTINVANDLTTGCVITVSVPGNAATKTYKLTYKIEESSNSHLADLQVGGTTIDGFAGNVTSYTVSLPLGTTSHPDITWTAGDAYQTISFTDGGLSSSSRLTVTAANGSQTVYRIYFVVEQSANCSLAGISLNGTPLEGFHPDTLAYNVTLPAGTNTAPVISYTAGDVYQTVTVSQGGLSGLSRITVKAGNGTTRLYTIRFQVIKSLNAFLKMIYLGGDSLENFVPQTLDYSVVLPTSVAPVITVDKEAGQTITLIQPGSYGTARIIVTPEEGESNLYTITFLSAATPSPAPRSADLLAPYNNALLSKILLDGVALPDFAPSTFVYTDSLPARTYCVPAVMPVAQKHVKEITIAYGQVNDTTRIHVVAEDGITTADYKIFFPVRALDDCTLADLTIDGVSFTFNPTQTDYNIQLPYGTTTMPAITAERRYDEQGVRLVSTGSIFTTSVATVTVTAPSGDSLTYNLHFSVAPSGLENSLTAIVVDGVGALDLTAGTDIDVVLPYGATDLVVSATSKRYPEQTVILTPGGLFAPTTIRVQAGQAGVDDIVYTLNPVRTINDPASLVDIKANGTTLSAFKPYQYSYVLPVTSAPAITYTPFTGAQVNVTASDTKHWAAEVVSADGNYTHTYTIYYYYTGDVIPSGNFNNWRNTTYNAAWKPEGWMVPADIVASYTFSFWTYTTGDEIRWSNGASEGYYPDASEGKSTVNLQSLFTWNTIAGTVPGIMTTGTLNMKLKAGGSSTSSVDGGIVFRNTPDTVKLDHKPINSTRVPNWRFLFNIHQNGAWQENLYEGSYEVCGEWNTYVKPLTYTGNPDSINIIINSMHSENMDDFHGTAFDQQHSELRVRNLLLCYNSRLASVLADGSPLTFTNGAATIAVTDPEYVGVPEFTFVGEVADQEHQVTWSDWTNGSRTALIRSIAEDGSYTDYTVTQTRPLSSSTAVSYTLTAANDLSIVRSSAYQQVDVTANDTAYIINVTAENGDTQHFVVLYTQPDLTPVETIIAPVDPIHSLGTSNGLLTDIAVDDATVSAFQQNTFVYNHSARGNYSAVRSYPLDSVFQTITDSLVTWQVFGAENHTYELHIALSDNALLSNILKGLQPMEGFYEQTFDYVVHSSTSSVFFPVAGDAKQDLDMKVVDQGGGVYTFFFVVRAENGHREVYTVQEIVRTPDTNADLSDIILGGTSLAGFTPTQTAYVINEQAGYVIPDITAVLAGEYASAEITSTTVPGENATATTFTITVTAEAGNTQVYTLTINVLPSDECHLEMIYTGTAEVNGFHRETFNYNIELPVGTTELPEIDYTKADENSTVVRTGDTLLTNGAATVVLTCTAQSGAQLSYTLNFTVLKSTESRLAMMYADGTALTGFDEDIFTYNINLPYGTTEFPVLTYDKKEPVQTVQESGVGTASVTFTVTAEDGVSTSTYSVNYTILPSTNALLQMIFLDSDSLHGFDPAAMDYTDSVPSAFPMEYPVVTWTAGDEQQQISLAEETVGTNLVATITVVAGDGTTTEQYTITFVRVLSDNNYLADLKVNGTTIEGFQRDSLHYEMVYPVGATTADFYTINQIIATAENIYAQVQIIQQDENTITIMVTAENGDIRVYVITQTITLSDNAFLKMIYLDGVELDGFDKHTFSYSRLLPQGATLPLIEAIPEDSLAEVSVTIGTVGDTTYIYCTAQSGAEQVYTLFFDYSAFNAGDNADIDDCILIRVPGTDSYKAVTIRSDVTLVVYDTNGQCVLSSAVPVVDPNYVRVETDDNGNQYITEVYDSANGFTFQIPAYNKTFFAVFYRQGGTKHLSKGAKFMLVR